MSTYCLPSGATPNRKPMASVVAFGEKDPGTVWAGQRVAWNPRSAYFSRNEKGLIIDPSDLSLLFQDIAGTTPVTGVEQPVGLVLDPSGNGANAYQATSTKRPVLRQTVGGLYYLEFDGIDDSFQTAAIDFSATDKMTVIAGITVKKNDSSGMLCELSQSTTTNPGTFCMFAPFGGAPFFSALRSRGTGAATELTQAFPVFNAPSVVTGLASISAPYRKIRNNGVQNNADTTDQGTGNYGNYPLFIGQRGSGGIVFLGSIYYLIVRGAETPTVDMEPGEAYVNGKTGAF